MRFRAPKLKTILQYFIIILMGYALYFICFILFPKWNEIPLQSIETNMIAMGYTSIRSFYNLRH